MSVKLPPHRPTEGELDAARKLNAPATEVYVASLFRLAQEAELQGQHPQALAFLRAVALARPDDPRVYQALGAVYQQLEQLVDAAACFSQAAMLRQTPSPHAGRGPG